MASLILGKDPDASPMVALMLESPVLPTILQGVLDRATTLAEQDSTSELKLAIEKLHVTLLMVKCSIGDTAKQVRGGESVDLHTWLINLRNVIYDADDVLDEMEYEQLGQEVMKGKNAMINPLRYAAARIKSMGFFTRSYIVKIGEIQERLDHLLSMSTDFKLEMTLENLSSVRDCDNDDNSQGRITSPHLFYDQDNIFGRNDERDCVITLLLDDIVFGNVSNTSTETNSNNSQVNVVAIVGAGGIGKTILAQLVFHSEKVNNCFELKFWVRVSDDFDVEGIIQDILKLSFTAMTTSESISHEEHDKGLSDWNDVKGENVPKKHQPREELKKVLKDTKFLLVLDDLQNEVDADKWVDLLEQLDDGKEGSTILVTSREKSFASGTAVQWKTVELGGLSDEAVNSLLLQHACCEDGNQQLQQISMNISEKLKGSPLAAKTIGRILSSNLSEDHWNKILKSEIWDLPQQERDATPALLVSYEHLPDHLKPCFIFCCVFPKNFRYHKRDIIEMWIALGLVPNDPGGSILAEDLGSRCMDDLLRMSMFQPCTEDDRVFKIHGSILDVARIVSDKEALLIRSRSSKDHIPCTNHIRHLVVCTDGIRDWKFLLNFTDLSNLRSLIFLNRSKRYSQFHNRAELPAEIMTFLEKNLPTAKSLRVLDLSNYRINDIPDGWFSNLKGLRYLDLSGTDIRKLPTSVTRLYHLQVLSIEWCPYLDKLPCGISNLVNLRHLHGKSRTSALIKAEDIMSNLKFFQDLDIAEPSDIEGREIISMLGSMKQLRKLRIRQLENVKSDQEAIRMRLRHMNHLTSLDVGWTTYGHRRSTKLDDIDILEAMLPHSNIKTLTIRNYNGGKGPHWLPGHSVLPNLQSIALEHCNNWEVLPPLGRLPHLKSLKLSDMERLREISSDFFALEPTTQMWVSRVSSITIEKCCLLENFLPWIPPTVSTLILRRCRKIRVTPTMATSTDIPVEGWLPPAIKTLVIENCGALSDMLLARHLQTLVCLQHLELVYCDRIKTLPASSLVHLQHLKLMECNNFETLPTAMLNRLRYLEIRSCDKLDTPRGVSDGFRALTSLKELQMNYCFMLSLTLLFQAPGLPSSLTRLELRLPCYMKALSYFSGFNVCGVEPLRLPLLTEVKIDGNCTMQLRRCLHLLRGNKLVRQLHLEGFWDLESFDACLESSLVSFESLENLTIEGFIHLQSLPDGLCKLSYLQKLRIFVCTNLRALPDKIPPALNYLSMCHCYGLQKQFARERHKVSHVKEVYMDHIRQDLSKNTA